MEDRIQLLEFDHGKAQIIFNEGMSRSQDKVRSLEETVRKNGDLLAQIEDYRCGCIIYSIFLLLISYE